jgi:hypothetical protein
LPAGMVRNASAFPTCSLATLASRGPSGCPSGSRIGTGTMAMLARPVLTDPIFARVTAFNGDGGEILLFVFPDLGPTFVIQGQALPNETIGFAIPDILTLPSAPNAAITDMDLTLGRSTSGPAPSDSVTKTWIQKSTIVCAGCNPPPHRPRIALKRSKTQRFKGSVTLRTGCDVACSISASARVSAPGSSKLFRSKRVTRSIAAGRTVAIKLKFSKRATRAIRAALKRRKRLTARISVQAKGAGPSTSTASSTKTTVKLKR